MDHHQQELRRAAAQAFADSLNKLEQTLCSPEDQPTPAISLSDLEQAVADIEQFVQAEENVSLPVELQVELQVEPQANLLSERPAIEENDPEQS